MSNSVWDDKVYMLFKLYHQHGDVVNNGKTYSGRYALRKEFQKVLRDVLCLYAHTPNKISRMVIKEVEKATISTVNEITITAYRYSDTPLVILVEQSKISAPGRMGNKERLIIRAKIDDGHHLLRDMSYERIRFNSNNGGYEYPPTKQKLLLERYGLLDK